MFPVRNQILIETTSRACVQSTGYLTQFGPQLRSLSLCRGGNEAGDANPTVRLWPLRSQQIDESHEGGEKERSQMAGPMAWRL